MNINWLKYAACGDKILMNMVSQSEVCMLQVQWWWWLRYILYSYYKQIFYTEVVHNAYVVRFTGFQVDNGKFSGLIWFLLSFN